MKLLFTKVLSGLQSRLSVVVITGLLSGAGVYAIYSMTRLADLTHQLYHHPFAVNVAVEGIKADIFAMHRSMKDVVLAESPAELDRAIQQVDATEAKALDRFNLVQERFLGDRQVIDQTRQSFINWKPIRNEVIQLKRAGRTLQKPQQLPKAQGANYVNQLVQQMDSVEDVTQKSSENFSRPSPQHLHSASYHLGYFTFLCSQFESWSGLPGSPT